MRRITWPLLAAGVMAAVTLAAAPQPLIVDRQDYPSATGARAIVAADFDRDGRPDIAHADLDGSKISILLNAGASGLEPGPAIPVGTGPFDLASADLDRDGIPDLVVANADSNTISVLRGRGDGSFARTDIPTQQSPRGVIAADVTEDGKLDLVYTAYTGNAIVLLRGDGRGRFVTASLVGVATRPQGLSSADINRDGHPDLVIACEAPEGLVVFYGPANAFTRAAIPGASDLNTVSIADVNGDGRDDVLAASTSRSRVAVYLGRAGGPVFSTSYAVDASPRDVAIADVTHDGAPDVITASRSTSTVNVLPGNPQQPGTFAPRLVFGAGAGSRAVVVADFDTDGLLDLATGNQYAAAVSVLYDATPLQPAGFAFGRSTLPAGVPLESRTYQNEGRGFAAADFNRDGRLDFVQRVADSKDVAVVITGGATVVLPAAPARPDEPHYGSIVGDFNGDGNADVIVNDGTRLIGFVGNGRGGFSAVSTNLVVGRCVAGDINRDARLDLVCVPDVLLGNGDGTFRRGAALSVAEWSSADLADINRDGKLDLAAGCHEFWLGDGAGAFTYGGAISDTFFPGVRAADMNHDGYVDLVCSDGGTSLFVALGRETGFEPLTEIYAQGLEANTDFIVADVNVDGQPDIVVNFLREDADTAGVMRLLPGYGDGTFGSPEPFAMVAGEVLVADVQGNGVATPDGLPDIVVTRLQEIVVLTNRRTATNRPPVIEAADVTVTYDTSGGETQCFPLPVHAQDPDQHALWIAWASEGPAPGPGPDPAFLMGSLRSATACTDGPGTYRFHLTASDNRGAVASRTITATVIGPPEIVVHMTRLREAHGRWDILQDNSAASGLRAYDRNQGTPKVATPLAQPADYIELGFVADPNRTYKLWLRLKADNNYWGNDSVWVQFSGSTNVAGEAAYRIGTTSGLAVNLEECANCGLSGWGWEDDGWGAPQKNGVLLRFPGGGQQQIRVQTREDGVSIDQIVLSAGKYLTARPGSAKNDTTILPIR